ncbi:hypothetical protein COO60DRAFT_1162574 [Scenedesmus sp. NREL 46B-D3]|nr:hypothetical protein COO60DRAFT_1162574 [Scenedesmus sp. NREL 46B-D3]
MTQQQLTPTCAAPVASAYHVGAACCGSHALSLAGCMHTLLPPSLPARGACRCRRQGSPLCSGPATASTAQTWASRRWPAAAWRCHPSAPYRVWPSTGSQTEQQQPARVHSRRDPTTCSSIACSRQRQGGISDGGGCCCCCCRQRQAGSGWCRKAGWACQSQSSSCHACSSSCSSATALPAAVMEQQGGNARGRFSSQQQRYLRRRLYRTAAAAAAAAAAAIGHGAFRGFEGSDVEWQIRRDWVRRRHPMPQVIECAQQQIHPLAVCQSRSGVVGDPRVGQAGVMMRVCLGRCLQQDSQVTCTSSLLVSEPHQWVG